MPRPASPHSTGRPRAFNEAEALDAAMRVFAAKGYDATSLTALEQAMGINRVSMYGAFGNKEALFVRALARYTEVGSARFAHCLAAPTAREAVQLVLREAALMFTDPQGHGTCFVTQAPLSPAEASDETRAFVAERRAGIEAMLRGRLQQGLDAGDLAPGTAINDLARFYAVTAQGLALQAQHGGTRDELLRVVDIAMTSWLQSCETTAIPR